MRLTVKRADNLINELRFSRGPIYVGRQIGSQIFLPDRAVSRQHTVMYTTTEGKWVVEDLDSANKTFLNEEPIHKSPLTDGDVLGIADFVIEVHLDEAVENDQTMSLSDTLHSTLHEPQVVLRHMESSNAPLIRMQAKRAKDFSYAVEVILECSDMNKLLQAVVDLMFKQFKAYQVWVSLRRNPAGAMEVVKGKQLGAGGVKIDELALGNRISEAVKNHQHILIPRLPLQAEGGKVHSAMVVPIMSNNSCYGVIYTDNSLDHEHFGLNDLDYLIFISIILSSHLKRLAN